MLRRYIPGKGYINLGVKDNKAKIIQNYSTIKGVCNLGSFKWNSNKICCEPPIPIHISQCYSLPILNGGTPNSLPSLFMDGGLPNIIGSCNINPSLCYSNSVLNGGTPNSLPSLVMNGGSPNVVGICNINA